MKSTRCPILYDQTGLLIISKPAGVLSHPNSDTAGTPLTHAPRCAFEGRYDFNERRFETPEGPIWLLHRLDQDTSGILVAARDQALAQKLRVLFEEVKIKKIYQALLMGQVRPAQGMWYDHMLTSKKINRVRSRIMPAKTPNAKLQYKLVRYFPKYRLSLVEMELLTGKTHQIRVQSSYRGHAVVGDEIYGNFSFNKKLRREAGLKRLFLHAIRFEMVHPITQTPILIEEPLPEDLQAVIEKISA